MDLPSGPAAASIASTTTLTLAEYKKKQQAATATATATATASKSTTLSSGGGIFSVVSSKKKEELTGGDKQGQNATEFWTDIYKFTMRPTDKAHLWFNHSISKESMVKLLQEQGTIKFNPIQYYRNTVESQEQVGKTLMDAIMVKVVLHCIKFLGPLNIHELTPAHLTTLGDQVSELIETSALSETTKLELITSVQRDLKNYKKPEVGAKYGFKYKHHLKCLESAMAWLEDDEDLMDKYVKQFFAAGKTLAMLLEAGAGAGAGAGAKDIFSNFAALEKVLKKECKFMASLPYDAKYFVRWVQYVLVGRLLEVEQEALLEKDKRAAAKCQALVDTYAELQEQMDYLLRAKLYPVLNVAHTQKVGALEVSLKLFSYASAKDRIIGELQQSNWERDSKHDAQLIERVKRHNYDEPAVLELANMIHSVILEANKVPLMVRILEYFTQSITARHAVVAPQTLSVFIELYTYILHYFAQNDTEYNKLSGEEKKKYVAAMARTDDFFARNNLDIFQYQMVHLYEHLSPLSHFDEKRPKLDQWQKNVFEMMDRRQNIIVIAPTSSGKTALSTYASLVFSRVLFVVPSAELARQVCGMIRNLVLEHKLKKHISLMTEKDVYHDHEGGASFDILVGTPAALEKYFVGRNLDTNMFDYIVFDEIHQLNQAVVGAELERWIKWLTHNTTSHFLALSACVGNAEELHAWWRQFVSDIALVCCNRRFLQQQKYLWKPQEQALAKIHPLAVISLDFLQNDGFIRTDDGTVCSDMAFTPDELYDLYSKLKDHPLFDKGLHPVEYFQSIRLTLENCKEWEWRIKAMLQMLARADAPFVAAQVLSKYLVSVDEEAIGGNNSSGSVETLYKLLKELQGKNLLPAILFRLDPNACQQIFTELVMYLKDEEARVFPYYYQDLEFCQQAYDQMSVREKELDKITLPEDLNVSAQVYIEERKTNLRASEFGQFQKNYTERMQARIHYAKSKYTEFKDNTVVPQDQVRAYLSRYRRQIRYYEKEIQRALKMEELTAVNIYQPHPDFTFLDEYISSDHIIEYRQQLMDYMKEEKKIQQTLEKQGSVAIKDKDKDEITAKEKSEFRTETYVSYDHPFIIGMERGVILYLNRLPTPFQRVAQSLIATTLVKLAPVTFSDHSLALGINYPIRSVVLTGGHIDPIMAHQMIGRAGRRGIDPKGTTIYYDVDWQSIIKEKYLAVRGSESLDGAIWSMPFLWTEIQNKFDLVTRFHLKDYTTGTTGVQAKYTSFMDDIHTIHETFQREFNVELLEDASKATLCLLNDAYNHKDTLGFQAVFLPYLLEEMSRWKFTCHKLDSTDKWNMIQVLTAFLNGQWDHTAFSGSFRAKIQRWPTTIVATYTKTHDYNAVRLEEALGEQHITYLYALGQLLSTLYSVCKDRRLNTAMSSVFLDIKLRLKKYTF
jgi:hypothetical protein